MELVLTINKNNINLLRDFWYLLCNVSLIACHVLYSQFIWLVEVNTRPQSDSPCIFPWCPKCPCVRSTMSLFGGVNVPKWPIHFKVCISCNRKCNILNLSDHLRVWNKISLVLPRQIKLKMPDFCVYFQVKSSVQLCTTLFSSDTTQLISHFNRFQAFPEQHLFTSLCMRFEYPGFYVLLLLNMK